METLRQLINKINTQLSDLTASQRLAIGLCAVIIVGSFLWLFRWSSEPDYVRLLEEPMTADQIELARQNLPVGHFRILGSHILVSPGERNSLFWTLQNAGALPADTSVTFSKLIEDDSPFRPASENQFRRRVALQNELAKVFASSGLVKSADVFITDMSARRIGSANTVPTASVTVAMASGQILDLDTVKACAALVAGAVPGLSQHNVSVIDASTLREFTVPSAEDALATGQLREKMRQEKHLIGKVTDQLSYIPGVRVAVSVQLDTSRKRTRDFTYAEPAVSEETSMTTETQSGGPSGESGVGPNVGQSLTTTGQKSLDTADESSTKFQDQPLSKETTTEYLPFAVTRTTASIGVPYSYIASVLGRLNGTDTEPTAEEINERFVTEQQRIRVAVKNIVMADADDDITVDMFPDLEPAVTLLADGSLASASTRMGTASWAGALREYAPEGGLVLLSMMGLMILARMAKRSARDATELYDTAGGEAIAGESGEPLTVESESIGTGMPNRSSMLEARELSEDVLRAAQLTDQVVQLVEDDPAAVSRMLGRWAETDD